MDNKKLTATFFILFVSIFLLSAQGTENALRAFFQLVVLFCMMAFGDLILLMVMLYKRNRFLRIYHAASGLALILLSIYNPLKLDFLVVGIMLVSDVFNFGLDLQNWPLMLFYGVSKIVLAGFLKPGHQVKLNEEPTEND